MPSTLWEDKIEEREKCRIALSQKMKPVVARIKPTGREFIVPRIIALIVRGTTKPRMISKFLLSNKTVHRFEQLLGDMTKTLKPAWGHIARVYALDGTQILSLQDFFKTHRIFIVSPNKPMQRNEFSLDAHETEKLETELKSMGGVPKLRKATNTSTVVPVRGRSTKTRNRSADSIVEVPEGQVWVRRSRSRVKRYSRKKVKLMKWAFNFTSFKESFHVQDIYDIDNYSILRRCRNRATDEFYWIKATNVNKLKRKKRNRVVWTEESNFLTEIDFLKTLRHPHIVNIWDCGTEKIIEPYIYVTYEYNQEGDLAMLMEEPHVFNEIQAAFIVRDVSSALEFLHDIKIVHRNIQPASLVVFPSGDYKYHVKLRSFEFAVRKTEMPLISIFGEMPYMAPEMLARVGYGPEVDIWALGVTLFQIIHGGMPFDTQDGLNPDDLKINSDKWVSLSEDCRATILGMLSANPEDRLTAEDILFCNWIENKTTNVAQYDGEIYNLFGQADAEYPFKPFRSMGKTGWFGQP